MPDDVAITWFIVVGVLFIGLALSGTVLKRLPLTTAMLYLAIGIGLGPAGIGLARLDPIGEAALVEQITELAVVISLFTAGLKLRTPLDSERWRSPVRLAFLSMAITVALVAGVGVVGLGLPLGAAVLLGAVLAPTDPVLASDVGRLPDPLDEGIPREPGASSVTRRRKTRVPTRADCYASRWRPPGFVWMNLRWQHRHNRGPPTDLP